MKNTKLNIEFFYEYRDAGGNRKNNSIILDNPKNIVDLERLNKDIRELLFDTEFFYPYLVDVPLLRFDDWDTDLDHHWYCFQSIELSESPPNDNKSRTIEQFIEDLKKYAQQYELHK